MLNTIQSNMQRNAFLAYCALVTPGNHVLAWVAPPGVGKTTFARAVGNALEVAEDHFLRWSVGQHGPEDFNGLAMPTPKGLVYDPAASVRHISDGKPGMWMFDELTNATRSTQAGCLKVLDERWVGDFRLPDSVKLIMAMNEPEHAADAQDISKPLANRTVWLNFLPPTPKDHVLFMQGTRGVTLDLPKWDKDAWLTARSEVVAIYTAFMLPPPEGMGLGVVLEDASSDQVISRFPLAYATPRSWEYALNLAATCRLFGDTEAMATLMTGTIGEPQGLAFMGFYNDQDLIPIAMLRERPSLWRPDPKRMDRTFTQLMAVAMAATDARLPEKEKGDWWNWGWEIIKLTLDAGAGDDLCLVAGQHLGTHRPKGKLLAEYAPIIQRLAPMVAAAGFGE